MMPRHSRRSSADKAGFTLIEVIIVLLIIAVLSVITVLSITDYTDQAKLSVDNATLKTLNNATILYRIKQPDPDPFNDSAYADADLIQLLISQQFLNGQVEAQQDDAYFHWDITEQIWVLNVGQVQTGGTSGWWSTLITGYSGTAKDIAIPTIVNGIKITGIYQDAFKNLGLTAVTFAADSGLTRIHARAFLNNRLTFIKLPDTITSIDISAFQNNDLTEIDLPDSLQKIEGKAFYDNSITKITIGSNVTIGDKAFADDNKFREAYLANGAGTYIYLNGIWVKQ